MKKLISSLLIITAASLANTPTLAAPITHSVDFICPDASALGHFGTYISGFGSEILSSRTTSSIYFQSRESLINVPTSLANYSNSGTNYNGPIGSVICSFRSSNPSESEFDISYNITNGKGGQILSRTNNTMRVLFFVGLGK